MEPTEAELEHQRVHGGGSWSALRAPFFTVIGVGVVAMAIYAPNALSSAMAILAASAGGVGVIIQVMGFLNKK